MKKLNARGSITIDYLFAFILVSGLSLIVMTFSATLSMVEVAQYMAFAASRNFYAGNLSPEKQKQAAEKKFLSLKSNPVLAPLLNGGWFEIPDQSFIVDFNISDKYPEFAAYKESGSPANLFHGVVLEFKSKVLDFKIPFFGSTKNSKSGSDETGFSTKITSFLGREPSFDECNTFNKQRWNAIKNLGGNYSLAQDNNGYVVINDNGC